ncbi:hypothetical protein Pcinc_038423 [Petrolisthes cinctipes]|uniref:Neurotransmitter-gated ion-channel transmembrane domain-containing protein n=1 Tax=Petrolisthes cinctipes TaxID=88211 RepID=A0AAE1BRV7_PETCI|nr:hypothetical protein Pcinc_038423 [Petrolisthes cinctipes]
MGNFLITVYGPCVLLVVLSWVSFWLNREATSDRISLGITTVLTMTFLGLEARTDLPKVPYSTALDIFVWLSYGFIFATIIEFAFVHVFTKVGSGEVYLSHTSSELDSDEEQDEVEEEEEEMEENANERPERIGSGRQGSLRRELILPLSPLPLTTTFTPSTNTTATMGPNGVGSSRPPLPHTAPSRLTLVARIAALCGGRKSSVPKYYKPAADHRKPQLQFSGDLMEENSRKEEAVLRRRKWEGQERRGGGGGGGGGERVTHQRSAGAVMVGGRRPMQMQANSVSNLDEISRVLFPLAFLAVNFLYWFTYLSQEPWPSTHL